MWNHRSVSHCSCLPWGLEIVHSPPRARVSLRPGSLNMRAGTPATISSAATSRVTTAPAPTRARRPIVTPPSTTAPTIEANTSLDNRLAGLPVAQPGSRAASSVVERGYSSFTEHDAVPDEDGVLESRRLSIRTLALDLALPPTGRAALNLDKRADAGVVPYLAAVQICEGLRRRRPPEGRQP